MNLLQSFVLGVVQGVTEFIPVSSTAHLVLVPWLLGWPEPPFEYAVLVQWGTLSAVIVYFGRDLWAIAVAVVKGLVVGKPFADEHARLGWLLMMATAPAGGLGLVFKNAFESVYSNPRAVAALLIGTALILSAAERFGQRRRAISQIGWLDAFIIGLWQAASILPGISRSGSTIGGGMLRHLTREAAARFGFLMAVPVMLGAGVIALKDLAESGTVGAQWPVISVGFIAAAVVGFVIIHWLLRYLRERSLYLFAAYCAVAGAGCLVIYVWR